MRTNLSRRAVSALGPGALLGASLVGTAVVVLVVSGLGLGAAPGATFPANPAPFCVSGAGSCSIHLSVSAGSAGNVVKVKVVGFAHPTGAITYDAYWALGGSATFATSGTVPSNHFTVSLTVPAHSPGAYSIWLTDSAGDNQSATFHITHLHLSVSPNSRSVSSNAVVKGTGFLPKATLALTMGGARIGTVGGCRTDARGTIIQGGYCVLYVPNLSKGVYKLLATDGTNTASARFTVT